MGRTSRSKDETAVLGGKGLLVLGVLLVLAGLFLKPFTTEGILLSIFGIMAAAAGLFLMKKPEYVVLLIGW